MENGVMIIKALVKSDKVGAVLAHSGQAGWIIDATYDREQRMISAEHCSTMSEVRTILYDPTNKHIQHWGVVKFGRGWGVRTPLDQVHAVTKLFDPARADLLGTPSTSALTNPTS